MYEIFKAACMKFHLQQINWPIIHIVKYIPYFKSLVLLTFRINSLKFSAIKWNNHRNFKLYYLKILKVKYSILTWHFLSSIIFFFLLHELF